MAETWNIVKSKKNKRNPPNSHKVVHHKYGSLNKIKYIQPNQKEKSTNDDKIAIEDISQEVCSISNVLQETDIYNIVLTSVRGLFSDATHIITLGIGPFSAKESCMLQFALALNLSKNINSDFPNLAQIIFDPVMSSEEKNFCRSLGFCTIESDIELSSYLKDCSDIPNSKTIFFMPHCPFESYQDRRIQCSLESTDCIHILFPIMREVPLWSDSLLAHPNHSRISNYQLELAFNDMSLMYFPEDLLVTDIALEIFKRRPSEDAMNRAKEQDIELL
eukprot:gene1691-3275_t